MSDRIAVLHSGKGSAPTYVSLLKVAHVSGNTVDALHCPFCGSGSVTARSDGTIECGFCTAAYTVQVQPQFSAFPQTVNGAPYPWPGRDDEGALPPGTDMEGEEGVPEEFGGDGEEEGEDGDLPPWMSDGDEDEGEEPDEDDDEDEEPEASVGGSKGPPPFAKKKSVRQPRTARVRKYRTAFGGLVDRDDYIDHLAMVTSDQPDRTAMLIKAERPA